VKRYANLKESALKAVRDYKEEVEKGVFPSEDTSFR
jgi:3-methyl-2-oxobutanoate hydroxymethyltransferase